MEMEIYYFYNTVYLFLSLGSYAINSSFNTNANLLILWDDMISHTVCILHLFEATVLERQRP
jgi:hypothetical protein